MGFEILPLVGARLGSQTLAVVGKRMRFLILSNKAVGVASAENCGSYESRMGF